MFFKLKQVLMFPFWVIAHFLYYRWNKPEGITASLVFFGFADENLSEKHGVVAFLVDPDFDDTGRIMHGPFGEKSIYYGRDTWGRVGVDHLHVHSNAPLRELAKANPGKEILLAGVRSFKGIQPYPLNDPNQYVLLVGIFKFDF